MAKAPAQPVDDGLEGRVILVDDDDEEQTPAELDREMALSNWINDLGGSNDAAILVYRIREKDNKQVYIDSLGMQEMDGPQLFQKLKTEYGGGKFRVQLRAEGRIRKTQTIEIEPPPPSAGPVSSNGGFGNVDLASVIREIKSTQEGNGNIELILSMMQRQNEQFQGMVTTLVAAMNQKPETQPVPTITDLVTSLASLKELSAPAQQTEPTELILKGVELATALRGDDGGEANMYSLLSKAVGTFGGTLQQVMAAGPQPNALAAMPAQTTPMQITAQDSTRPPGEALPAPEPQTAEMEPQAIDFPEVTLAPDHPLASYEPFVNWLCGMAAKNADPDLYAEVVVDQIGMENAQQWLVAEEGRAAILQHLPKVQPFMPWLTELAAAIDAYAAELQNDGESQPDGDGSVREQPAEHESANAAEGAPTDGDTIGAAGDSHDLATHVAPGVTIED